MDGIEWMIALYLAGCFVMSFVFLASEAIKASGEFDEYKQENIGEIAMLFGFFWPLVLMILAVNFVPRLVTRFVFWVVRKIKRNGP